MYRTRAPPSTTVGDLAALSRLDETTMVDHLRFRFQEDLVYTYVADILVAVNPFHKIPALYTKETQRHYMHALRTQNPPHVFAIADQAYQNMLHTSFDQCCLVSGESGAGKTESAKLIVRQIVELCRSGVGLENKILQVNPLLEAFGNAQTTMNDNSSRFGKYTELIFDSDGKVRGAIISEYLLEKSRVVRQQPGEQNFHVFYYLFGLADAKKFHLTFPEDYPYLGQSKHQNIDAKMRCSEVAAALGDVGFTSLEQEIIYSILGGILNLSKVQFTSSGDLNPALISEPSKRHLSVVASMLQVNEEHLTEALTIALIFARGELIKRPYTVQLALDARDALAKALYGRLFAWIVSTVNRLLAPSGIPLKPSQIGILDIFGFECFTVNSFEQLCINIANECLQHFFNKHVFEIELEEYRSEGFSALQLRYADNEPLLDMLMGKPLGLLSLLDDECVLPRASDASLTKKFAAQYGTHESFLPAKNNACMFTIKHFAGPVTYTSSGFLAKNKDYLAMDLVVTFQESSCKIISEMFLSKLNSSGVLEANDLRRKSRRSLSSESLTSEDKSGSSNKRPNTVGHQFKISLSLLIDKMSACRPFFVRCIKPNAEKRPHVFSDELVLRQLKYSGMLEAIRIRREGFSERPTLHNFVHRFRVVALKVEDKISSLSAAVASILERASIKGAMIGKSKVFLKYNQMEALEQRMSRLSFHATIAQKVWKGYRARKVFRQLLIIKQEKEKEEKEKKARALKVASSSSLSSLPSTSPPRPHSIAQNVNARESQWEIQVPPSAEEQEETERKCILVFEGLKNEEGRVLSSFLAKRLKQAGIEVEDDPRFLKLHEHLFADFESAPLEISFAEFKEAAWESIHSLQTILSGKGVVKEFHSFKSSFHELYLQFAEEIPAEKRGGRGRASVADLSSLLMKSVEGGNETEAFGLKNWVVACCTAVGRRLRCGYYQQTLPLNEIGALVLYGLALEEVGGPVLHSRVGREHSGGGYTDIGVNASRIPYNPLVQAGALVCCAAIQPQKDPQDRFKYVEAKLSKLIGGRKPHFNMECYLEKKAHFWKIKATGFFLKEKKALPEDANLEDILNLYIQVMSFELDVESGSILAGTLANGGKCPITNEQVLSPSHVRSMLAIMHTCGMDKNAGVFAFNVGFPARNSSSGAILTVVPGAMGICSFSDDDSLTNVRGRGFRFLHEFSKRFTLGNLFSNKKQSMITYDYYVEKDSQYCLAPLPLLPKSDPTKFNTEDYEDAVFLFFTSARIGDLANIRRCINRGLTPNTRDYVGRTTIHVAASAGHHHVVKVLLQAGGDKYILDQFGKKPSLGGYHWYLLRLNVRRARKPMFSAFSRQRTLSQDK